MDPDHAAFAARELLKIPMVISMHCGTFPPLKGTPQQFEEALAGSSVKLTVMSPGQEIAL